MTGIGIAATGPYSFAAGARFLEGFAPAAYQRSSDGVLRIAFPADDAASVVGAALRGPGGPGRRDEDAPAVTAELSAPAGAPAPDPGAARSQLARILSLDVDGSDFPAAAAGDDVASGLLRDHPGLRPVCFFSPYEAACWAVIGTRVRMAQAAKAKARIAREHGATADVAGEPVHAFPVPAVLRTLKGITGLPAAKTERLHGLADAALDGRLDAAALRALPVGEALAALRALPGIGPFGAELVLIRGAGHPDVFPRHEPRLLREMAAAYRLPDPDGDPATVDRLAEYAERWRPYRSWVAFLFRARAEERAASAAMARPRTDGGTE